MNSWLTRHPPTQGPVPWLPVGYYGLGPNHWTHRQWRWYTSFAPHSWGNLLQLATNYTRRILPRVCRSCTLLALGGLVISVLLPPHILLIQHTTWVRNTECTKTIRKLQRTEWILLSPSKDQDKARLCKEVMPVRIPSPCHSSKCGHYK